MSIRRAASTGLLAMAVCFAAPDVAGIGAHGATPKSLPNFLLIVTDDQAAEELSCYDADSQLKSPSLAALARQGMVIDRAYHMGSFVSAVCRPSRHMIMSGRTLWHLPGSPEAANHCPPDLAQQTLGAVFRRAGYETMRTCKPGNSYPAANDQFAINRTRDGRGPQGSQWHADQVLEFIEGRAEENSSAPFFIYFGFSHPHDPRNGRSDLLRKYGANNTRVPLVADPAAPRLPVNYLPAHPFPFRVPDARDETRVQGVWSNRDEPTIRNELGRYYACIEEIDRQIGRVLTRLEELGELNQTYVVFTSDHGIAIGRHGLQGKQNLYEHSWRVPLIVQGPGIRSGSRAKGNVYLLDLLATFCDLAGIAAPPTSEGVSFKPVLEGRQDAVREVLYGAFSGDSKPGIRCIRKGHWKLIKYEVTESEVIGGPSRHVRETQLFHLGQNPHELLAEHHDPDVIALTKHRPSAEQLDLAEMVRFAAVRKELEALLLAEQERLHDPYRFSDQPGVIQSRQ